MCNQRNSKNIFTKENCIYYFKLYILSHKMYENVILFKYV